MKTKKLGRKLSINKKTIANLNSYDMIKLRGGAENTVTCAETCPTCGALTCGPASCQPYCWTSINPRATCETDEPWCF